MSFRGFFITFSVLAILVLAGGGFFIWYQARTSRGMDIELTIPEEIVVGAPFELKVGVSNDSQNVLQTAELLIELPEGIAFLGSSPEKIIDTKILGNLGVGSLTEETFRLLALGGEQTVKEIKATVTYLPAALGSKFERSESVDFAIVGSGLALDFSLPSRVFAGEELEAVITYKNISEIDFEDLRLRIIYPPAFAFKSASLKPDFGNNFWELGDLKKNSEGKLTIRGELRGPDESFFEIESDLEVNFLGKSYTIARKAATIAIASSPLSLAIDLNKNPDFIAYERSDLNYVLNFVNNTEIGLRDVIIRAKLAGEMFDLSTLTTNASLRTFDNTLIWDTSNTPPLAVLSPGSSGSVEFRLKTKPAYPVSRLSDKNFTLRVEAEIESPTVPEEVSAQKTLGVAKLETKVGGKIVVEPKGFFRDAPSGILNAGPWPMKVGQPTNFTIHWLVTNSASDVSNVEIKAFLGRNVRMTGVVKSNIGTEPEYNERTQEVVWKIERLTAGRGILSASPEAIFQIEATPSLDQAGSKIILLQETSVTAFDEFTGETLTWKDPPISSDGLDDSTVKPAEGTVAQ